MTKKLAVWCLSDLSNTLLHLWSLTRFTFLVQKISWWSEIAELIIPDWKIFSVESVRIWSIKAEVLHETCAGHVINYFKEWIWQISLYLFIIVWTDPWEVVLPFNFRMYLPFWKRLMLKSLRRYIWLSFRFKPKNISAIKSMNSVWFGGL